ncbi:MAG: PfkB family carbohydrate kinase [Pseudomonadota bacterium]
MCAKRVVGIGGAHVDWIAKMGRPNMPGASTPGSVETYVGGCCLNSLRVLAQLSADCSMTMISARGADTAGELVQTAIEEAGLDDQSAVFLDRSTPTYTAILNAQGDVQAAVADMVLYEESLPRHLRRREVRDTLHNADILVIDANLPGAAIKTITSAFEGMIVGLAISPAKASRLIPSAKHFDIVFMNHREKAALGDLQTAGFKDSVITQGNGNVLVSMDGAEQSMRVPPVPSVVDVTGAGDALAGATLAALISLADFTLFDAVKLGITAAGKTVKERGPIAKLDWADLLAEAKSYDS